MGQVMDVHRIQEWGATEDFCRDPMKSVLKYSVLRNGHRSEPAKEACYLNAVRHPGWAPGTEKGH